MTSIDRAIALRCRCNRLEGALTATHRAGRAVCYCRDCQAFARFLGSAEHTLDPRGGTDIVATSPRYVRFVRGHEQLRCMSLSGKGLLRWYAGCCRTPIGNTPRNPKLHYVGLIRDCLAGTPAEIDAAFGPAKVAINTDSANGKVDPTPVAAIAAVLKIMGNVCGSRLSGKFRVNPFFKAGSTEPIAAPQVLSAADRQKLRGDA
jgi:hypothetical protein